MFVVVNKFFRRDPCETAVLAVPDRLTQNG